MKLQLQQEENRSGANQEDEGDSLRRSDCRGQTTPDEPHSDLFREMRKEMDELRKAIKGQTDRSLDRMVKTIDSSFTTVVLECPVLSNSDYLNLSRLMGLRTLWTTSALLRRL